MQVRHHLTTVTDPQRKSIIAMEEALERITCTTVEQYRLGPAFTRTQHVTVRETATGSQTLEFCQIKTTFQNVTHVHVNRTETSTVKCCRHFALRVHTLLTQNSYFRISTFRNKRCGHILIQIEAQFHVQTRIVNIQFRLMFTVSTGRVITHTLHQMRGFRPDLTEVNTRLRHHDLIIAGKAQRIFLVQGANDKSISRQTMTRQRIQHGFFVCTGNLNDSTQLFVKQHSQIIRSQLIQLHADTGFTGKRHFSQGDKQTTVRAVVVSQQFAFSNQCLHRIEEAFQLSRTIHIRCFVTQLLVDLSQTGCTQTVFTITQIDKDQVGFTFVSTQLWCHGITHVIHTGKGSNDQRQRCNDLSLFITLLPAGLHRHRVFTDRYSQFQFRTQFFTHRFHGGIQTGIFTRMTRCGHPVR
eukprot:RCo036074